MPTSRFPFSLTYLVAAGLILGFHSSPYFVLSPGSVVAAAFVPGGSLLPDGPAVNNPFEVAPAPSDGGLNDASNPNTYFTNDPAFNSTTGVDPYAQFGAPVQNQVNQLQSGSNAVNQMNNGASQMNNFGGGGGFTNPLKHDKIEDFLYALLGFVIQIGYIVAVFFIILSGFYFVMAQGNDTKLEKAKEMLLWTVIGTAILIGAQVIATVIKTTIDALGPAA